MWLLYPSKIVTDMSLNSASTSVGTGSDTLPVIVSYIRSCETRKNKWFRLAQVHTAQNAVNLSAHPKQPLGDQSLWE